MANAMLGMTAKGGRGNFAILAAYAAMAKNPTLKGMQEMFPETKKMQAPAYERMMGLIRNGLAPLALEQKGSLTTIIDALRPNAVEVCQPILDRWLAGSLNGEACVDQLKRKLARIKEESEKAVANKAFGDMTTWKDGKPSKRLSVDQTQEAAALLSTRNAQLEMFIKLAKKAGIAVEGKTVKQIVDELDALLSKQQ